MTSNLLTAMQLTSTLLVRTLQTIVDRGADYGRQPAGSRFPVLLEYVSADPIGPLALEHLRGGFLGDSLAGLLAYAGHTVTREFYVNDATNSRQTQRFARALLGRYRSLLLEAGSFDGDVPPTPPASDYPDLYLQSLAQMLIEHGGDRFYHLPEETAVLEVQRLAGELVHQEQEQLLDSVGIRFDNWFSESDLHRRGLITPLLERLRDGGHTYEQAGALWLRSTAFGDESDRTLVRPDGSPTYLAGDLAYHADKFDRGFTHLVDIWNADHMAYVARTRAGLAALGYDPERLTIILHGPARLLQGGTEAHPDPRPGLSGAPTLAEARRSLSPETMRLMLLRQPPAVSVDLDIDAASRRHQTNPSGYLGGALQTCRAQTAGTAPTDGEITAALSLLIEHLAQFPEAVETAARGFAPHLLLDYASRLAELYLESVHLHSSFPLLAQAVAVVLENSLGILGAPPESPDRLTEE